jgi:hypothetical protein
MVSEVLVHGQMAPLQWPVKRQNIMVIGTWDRVAYSPHGNREAVNHRAEKGKG